MNTWNVMLAVLAVAIPSYLAGSVCFSIIVSRERHKDDVRAHGSGNAGMTNMLRTYGLVSAMLTLIGDTGKGALMSWIGTLIFRWLLPGVDPIIGGYLAAVVVIIGHARPIFFSFRGGKGIMAMAGSILALDPISFLCGLIVFLAVFFSSRMISLASVTISVLLPVLTAALNLLLDREMVFSTTACLIMGIMLVVLHRANIQRILAGTGFKFDKNRPL